LNDYLPKTDARPPIVGVVIVHFGQPHLTQRCLQALLSQEGLDLRVVLVDNSPNGDAPKPDLPAHPCFGIRCTNLGFAHANNQGLAWLQSENVQGVLLLNNDAFAQANALQNLWNSAQQSAQTGEAVLVGGCLVNEDGSLQTRGGCWYPERGFGEVLLDDKPTAPGVIYPSGAAFFLNKTALDRLEWRLDDGYFLYFEEADTVQRLSKTGPLQVILEASATFIHLQGATAGSGKRHHDRSVRSEFHFHRSKRRFYGLHYPQYLPKMHVLHVLVVFKRLLKGETGRALAVAKGFWGG